MNSIVCSAWQGSQLGITAQCWLQPGLPEQRSSSGRTPFGPSVSRSEEMVPLWQHFFFLRVHDAESCNWSCISSISILSHSRSCCSPNWGQAASLSGSVCESRCLLLNDASYFHSLDTDRRCGIPALTVSLQTQKGPALTLRRALAITLAPTADDGRCKEGLQCWQRRESEINVVLDGLHLRRNLSQIGRFTGCRSEVDQGCGRVRPCTQANFDGEACFG